jgi:hypothetical protein
MNGRPTRIVVVAIVAAVVASGCSGDNGSGARLSKAQYIAKADQICKTANDRTAALVPPTTPDPQALATFLSKSGRIVSDAAGQLKKLNPPAADEHQINQLIEGIQTSARLFPPLVAAVRAQDTQKIQRLAARLRDASLRGSKIAQTYGFHVCAHATSAAATPTP